MKRVLQTLTIAILCHFTTYSQENQHTLSFITPLQQVNYEQDKEFFSQKAYTFFMPVKNETNYFQIGNYLSTKCKTETNQSFYFLNFAYRNDSYLSIRNRLFNLEFAQVFQTPRFNEILFGGAIKYRIMEDYFIYEGVDHLSFDAYFLYRKPNNFQISYRGFDLNQPQFIKGEVNLFVDNNYYGTRNFSIGHSVTGMITRSISKDQYLDAGINVFFRSDYIEAITRFQLIYNFDYKFFLGYTIEPKTNSTVFFKQRIGNQKHRFELVLLYNIYHNYANTVGIGLNMLSLAQ